MKNTQQAENIKKIASLKAHPVQQENWIQVRVSM